MSLILLQRFNNLDTNLILSFSKSMKRLFDLILSLFLSVLFFIPCIIITIFVKIESKGPALYWSDRVGIRGVIFKMPKFRTMKVGTPAVATHLLDNAENHYTKLGDFLRKTSLDELPQIYSVLTNNMSFVGPRPALFNQYDLMELRTVNGIDLIKPGITGWAQVNGRDELSIEQKVKFEVEYLENKSFLFDLNILWLTLSRVLKSDGISH